MEFQIPDKNAPGYFRRMAVLNAFLNAEPEDKHARMLDWLALFVIGDTPEEKMQSLLDASQAEIDALNAAIEAANQSDPKGSAPSGDG